MAGLELIVPFIEEAILYHMQPVKAHTIHILQVKSLSLYEYTSMFFTIFTKGNNIHDSLVAALVDDAFLKWGLLLKKRIAPKGANSSL